MMMFAGNTVSSKRDKKGFGVQPKVQKVRPALTKSQMGNVRG